MSKDTDNPYAPSTADIHVHTQGKSNQFFWLRTIFFVHLVAIASTLFAVSSETILSDRFYEFFIVLPILSTTVICPIAMLIAAIVSTQLKLLVRGLAVCVDLVLSSIHVMIWLPTVQ